ncbi:MAG: biopolymer transporter ExbD [Burkholderiaceae bacterium]
MSKLSFTNSLTSSSGASQVFANNSSASHEGPEINLIAFIDVLLVLLMFLMLTTVYANKAGLSVVLPTAKTQTQQPSTHTIVVRIDSKGNSAVNGTRSDGGTAAMGAALLQAAGTHEQVRVVIEADGSAPHQAVIDAMSSARLAGLNQLQFATRVEANGR